MEKTYKRAIEILNKSRRQRRPSVGSSKSLPGLSRAPGLYGAPSLKGTPSIFGMRQWLDRLGHSSSDIDDLNVIHIAGTKGKGSTCAFAESFLRAHGRRTGFPSKTGLYTSPHLIYPEERVRINFQPLPQELFAKYFFEVYDVLSQPQPQTQDFDMKPRYLQLFALVAFHAFIKEGVDAAIFETHHGGEYDSTNIVERPVVTAITPLGMDHVKQLGPSIENIAWHKSGIFRPGVPAFSALQDPTASEVLQTRASTKGVKLQYVQDDPSPTFNALQLKPKVQKTNCLLALACVRSFLDQKTSESHAPFDSSDVSQGINQFSWPGRFQIVVENDYRWFLDGAHNEMSVVKAAEWFIDVSQMQGTTSSAIRILVFSQFSDQRDGYAVFERLANALRGGEIQYVIFTTYEQDESFEPLTIRQTNVEEMPSVDVLSDIWKSIHPNTGILFESTIQKALNAARDLGKEYGGMHTLITGSLYLVGGALSLLKSHNSAQEGSVKS